MRRRPATIAVITTSALVQADVPCVPQTLPTLLATTSLKLLRAARPAVVPASKLETVTPVNLTSDLMTCIVVVAAAEEDVDVVPPPVDDELLDVVPPPAEA